MIRVIFLVILSLCFWPVAYDVNCQETRKLFITKSGCTECDADQVLCDWKDGNGYCAPGCVYCRFGLECVKCFEDEKDDDNDSPRRDRNNDYDDDDYYEKSDRCEKPAHSFCSYYRDCCNEYEPKRLEGAKCDRESGKCCYTYGAFCDYDSQCCDSDNNKCIKGRCTLKTYYDSEHIRNREADDNDIELNRRCKREDFLCSDTSECCRNHKCWEGVCKHDNTCEVVHGECVTGGDCCAFLHLDCENNRCCKSIEGECSNYDDCCSKACGKNGKCCIKEGDICSSDRNCCSNNCAYNYEKRDYTCTSEGDYDSDHNKNIDEREDNNNVRCSKIGGICSRNNDDGEEVIECCGNKSMCNKANTCCAKPSGECRDSDDCCGKSSCKDYKCCKKEGAACRKDSQCCYGGCIDGTCLRKSNNDWSRRLVEVGRNEDELCVEE